MKNQKILDIIFWSVFIVFTLFTGGLIYQSIYSPTTPDGKDFVAFWSAAKLSAAGQPELAYHIDKMKEVVTSSSTFEKSFAWLYPPTFQALLYPLGSTSYRTAFTIFISTTAILFVSTLLYFCRRQYRMLALSAPTLFIGILFGQNSLATAALGMISISLMRSHPMLSGVTMGILSIKPHLFLCLPLLALIEKRWTVLAWATITTLSLIIYSLILLGPSPWYSFLENAKQASNWLQDGTLSIDLMTSIAANMLLFGYSPRLAMIAHITSLMLLFFSAFVIFKKTQDINLRGATTIIIILNLSPYMFLYELSWLSIALIFMLNAQCWTRREEINLVLIWFFPLMDFIFNTTLEKSFSLTPIMSYITMLMILKHILRGTVFPIRHHTDAPNQKKEQLV